MHVRNGRVQASSYWRIYSIRYRGQSVYIGSYLYNSNLPLMQDSDEENIAGPGTYAVRSNL